MTGRPGVALPDGWDAIPGARGCTPQNCAIRDTHRAFVDFGVTVVALSTQAPDYQAEMASRLHLPYPVLSDADLALRRRAAPADLRRRRRAAHPPPHARREGRRDRARVLSRVSAGPQHRAGAGLARYGCRAPRPFPPVREGGPTKSGRSRRTFSAPVASEPVPPERRRLVDASSPSPTRHSRSRRRSPRSRSGASSRTARVRRAFMANSRPRRRRRGVDESSPLRVPRLKRFE